MGGGGSHLASKSDVRLMPASEASNRVDDLNIGIADAMAMRHSAPTILIMISICLLEYLDYISSICTTKTKVRKGHEDTGGP